MPAGKRQQSNTTLYTLITFVGLFIIAATVAVIYYVKFEQQNKIADTSQRELEKMATKVEQRKGLGKIVGTLPRGRSGLGTMVDYLDSAVSIIIGGPLEDTSAEVKIDNVNIKVKSTLETLARKYPDIGIDAADTDGLIWLIEKLQTKLDETTNAKLAVQQQLEWLQNRFDDAMATGAEKEQTLLAEKDKYQQRVDEIQKNYDELKALLEQTTERQIQTLIAQRDRERAEHQQLTQQLLKTQAELKIAEDRIKHTQKQLEAIVPPPDSEVTAFQPDGKIIMIDDRAKIVHLNIGSNDKVFQGLTFSVYEKNIPIPKNGRGKAEIEVFSVDENISAARIIRSKKTNPIVLDDNVANLIWDSSKTNIFVVAGEFDLDDDGDIDYEAVDKIESLIEKWGGKSTDTVTIDADFLVLGRAPQVRKRPTFEEMEADPMAMQKYEDSIRSLNHYNEVLNRAETLSIPVFDYERFLYFIGYKTQSRRPGAF